MFPPLHPNCRCSLNDVEAIDSGKATAKGNDGADYWLKHYGHLPSYYISSFQLEMLGWRKGDKPSKFAPGKMLGNDIYNRSFLCCLVVYGMKPILTILQAKETAIESYGQMTD